MDKEKLKELFSELSDEEQAEVRASLAVEDEKPEAKTKTEEVDIEAQVKEFFAAQVALRDKEQKDKEAEESKKALDEERAKAAETRKVDPADDDKPKAPVIRYRGLRKQSLKTLDDVLYVRSAIHGARAPITGARVAGGLGDMPEDLPVGKWFAEDFQRWSDDMYILSRVSHVNGLVPDITKTAAYNDFWRQDAVQSEIKALYSTGATVGDEWVPTEFSEDWMELVGTQGEVLPTFRTFDMATATQTFPVFNNRTATMYLQGEAVSNTPVQFRHTDVTTAQLSLTAKQLALHIKWSQEFAEDAIAGSMEYVRLDLANSAAQNLDEAIINGDASADGFDTGESYESDSRYRAFNGLRHYVHVTDTTARTNCINVTWSNANNFLSTLGAMNKYAGDRPIFLADKATGQKLGLLVNTSNALVASPTGTTDAAARGNPKLTGILGMNIIHSEAMPINLNSSGVYDGSTTTYTAPLIYNPDAFYIGKKRGWTLEVEKDIVTGTWDLVMTTRLAFSTPYTTGEIVGECYGVLNAW